LFFPASLVKFWFFTVKTSGESTHKMYFPQKNVQP